MNPDLRDPDFMDPVTRLDLEPGGDRWRSVCFMDCDPSFCNFMDCEEIGRGSMDCEDKLDCSVASSITDK